jgi:EpsI family protein
MGNTATRIYMLAAMIVGVYGLNRLVQAQTEPPEVEMPSWSFESLPEKLGAWRGERTTLDPEIAAATGAATIVDRIYRDDRGHVVSLHSAMFSDPVAGIYHTPMNCYFANGWKTVSKTEATIDIGGGQTIPVRLVYWEKENNQVLVAFWYQVGDHILYTREDMPALRWKMWGQPVWPAMFKMMLQVSVTGTDDPREVILDLGGKIAQWINQPAHKSYLDRWPEK